MKSLNEASIEELEQEILKRKMSNASKEEKLDIKYEELKKTAMGHCIIHWEEANGGGKSLAVFGVYGNGVPWFSCSNWTGDENKMTTTSLREYVEKIKRIEQVQKYI